MITIQVPYQIELFGAMQRIERYEMIRCGMIRYDTIHSSGLNPCVKRSFGQGQKRKKTAACAAPGGMNILAVQ